MHTKHAINTTLYLLISRDIGIREELHMRCPIQGRAPRGTPQATHPPSLWNYVRRLLPSSLSTPMGLPCTFSSFFISAGNPCHVVNATARRLSLSQGILCWVCHPSTDTLPYTCLRMLKYICFRQLAPLLSESRLDVKQLPTLSIPPRKQKKQPK
jgi:hypothetical protein